MELTNEQVRTPAQSWTSRAESKPLPKVDYYSELRSWLQRAIMEAEKNKNFDKKDQLLILLNDL
jgi:hypothetical protein